MSGQKVPKGYKQTEVGVIPEDWNVYNLGDFTSVSSGGTPNRGIAGYWNGEIPWLTTTQISFGVINSAKEFITEEGLKNSATKVYEAGTLLMAMYGQGKTRGTVSIMGISAAINQACAAISIPNSISKSFIFYNLSSRYHEIRELSNTGNQENLNSSLIRNISIALPPTIAEQKQIALALSDTDALIEALEGTIGKKRQIKQGAMQELLTGKRRLPGFDGDWTKTTLGKVCSHIIDGTHYTPKYVENGIPFYSVETVTDDNFSDTKFISYEEHQNLIRRCKPERGDILMTRIGSLGKTKLIDWDVDASIYVSLALLKLNNQISAEYVYRYTQSEKFIKDLEQRSLIHAAPKKINLDQMSGIPIHAPTDIHEQTVIATILSDMDVDIAAIEEKLTKTRQLKQGMMYQLLTGRIRLL
jgi:type I restriction enzyme, S subunit